VAEHSQRGQMDGRQTAARRLRGTAPGPLVGAAPPAAPSHDLSLSKLTMLLTRRQFREPRVVSCHLVSAAAAEAKLAAPPAVEPTRVAAEAAGAPATGTATRNRCTSTSSRSTSNRNSTKGGSYQIVAMDLQPEQAKKVFDKDIKKQEKKGYVQQL
jgi:hypothetical protein